MKILFVYPNLMREEYLPLGVAYLSAYLKREGHSTAVMDYTWGGSPSDCVRKAREFAPDVIGFSLRSGEFDFSLEVARALKNDFDSRVPIIFGGVHPTVAPEENIAQECVDAICLGEGELAFVELLAKMQAGKNHFRTKNFWFKKSRRAKGKGARVIRNPVRPLIQDLDSLPFPDRELFDFPRYLKNRSGAADVMAGRGCPFNCTYCINHILQKMYAGKGCYVRMRSVDNVLSELREVKQKYGEAVSFIAFEDDTFTSRREWIKEFSRKYSREFKMRFSCNARPETITRDVARDLKKAGCVALHIGIESGNEQLRKKVLRRMMSNEQIVKAFTIAREAGIHTSSFNMVGLPFETRENIQETIELNKKIKPDFVDVSIFQPYPGTELYRVCKENGWLREEKVPFSHKFVSILDYPDLSRTEIKRVRETFRYNILKETNWKKAWFTRLLDSNYEAYIKVRSLIPGFVKSFVYELLRK